MCRVCMSRSSLRPPACTPPSIPAGGRAAACVACSRPSTGSRCLHTGAQAPPRGTHCSCRSTSGRAATCRVSRGAGRAPTDTHTCASHLHKPVHLRLAAFCPRHAASHARTHVQRCLQSLQPASGPCQQAVQHLLGTPTVPAGGWCVKPGVPGPPPTPPGTAAQTGPL